MKNYNDIELFRVRKSWFDIASQVGAFFILENAVEAAKESGCNVYNSKKECVWNYKEEKLCLKLH
mgnify:CR=1 FL=1